MLDFLKDFMIIIASVVSVRCVFLIFLRENEKQVQKSETADCIIVRQPTLYVVVGVILLFFSALVVLLMQSDLTDRTSVNIFSVSVLVVLPALFGLYFIISTLFFKIEVFKNRDYITYRSLFRIKRTIYYKDIVGYTESQGTIKLFVNDNKKYCISGANYNSFRLLKELRRHNVKRQRRSNS